MASRPQTYLLNPKACQWTLSNACQERPLLYPEEETPSAGPDSAPEGSRPAPLIRYAILLTREGNLVCQSDGLDAEPAALTAGLVANIWKQQQTAIQQGKDEKEKAGDMQYVFTTNKEGLLGVAGCNSNFLVCMMADRETKLGLFKSRLRGLANCLKDPLAKVSPPPATFRH